MKFAPQLTLAGSLALGGLVCLAWWNLRVPLPEPRLPTPREDAGAAEIELANPGLLTPGAGAPSALAGRWGQFRGDGRDNRAAEIRTQPWPGEAPREVWRIEVGEGHAGPAIAEGRVYLVDYDREREETVIRCLSLDDGADIWRYSFTEPLKRNHGMSRTVPAVGGGWVVAMSPKCRVVCLNAMTGELNWELDLKQENGVTVPPWYAGQCPLIDGDRVILAPAATPLMMALDLASGERVWETTDHEGMGMTHSSIVPVELGGARQYVYCTGQGVVGVSADDGRVLWQHRDWKIGIANIPSPLPVGENRLFFTGGYNAGSQMVRVVAGEGGEWGVEELFRIETKVFGSDQQTPILHGGHIFGVTGGRLTALDPTGTRVWESAVQDRYGLGPFVQIGELLYVLNDQKGNLDCYRLGAGSAEKLAGAKILNGHDAWAPMATIPGRLILRDLTELVCLEI